MKWIVSLTLAVLAAGCGEPFAGGFAAGAASYKAVADDAQSDFIEAVKALNSETGRLNDEIEVVKAINIKDFVKPEAITAIESLKGKEKDPTLWIALASMLLGGTGVNIFKNRKAGNNG